MASRCPRWDARSSGAILSSTWCRANSASAERIASKLWLGDVGVVGIGRGAGAMGACWQDFPLHGFVGETGASELSAALFARM